MALGLAASTQARADCQPSPAASGQTVTCAGTDPNGFQAGAGVNSLTVNVLAGASVFDNGAVAIRVRNSNTVTNNGTITAGAGLVGIRAGNDNVIANFATIMTGNGGAGIVAGDRNTIDNSGSITTGRFGAGIVAGDRNTITNSGMIATGRSGTGVSVGNQNTVTNAGTITTGRFGVGIMAGDRNTVTNSGAITAGRFGAGIVAGDRNTVDNSGAITTGRSGAGIAAGDRNAVTNSGAITTGRSGFGIVAGDRNTIDNAGTITTGRFGTGIQADDHNIITNSGTIATGRLGIGMSVGNRNTITNAGTITTAAFGIGIQAGNHNVIDNSGAITTGRFGAGIVAGKRNAVTNTGTITGGDASVGILALKRNNVVNDGNITVGPAGTGIAIGFGNTVINNGSVVAGANGVSIGACFLCFLPSINNTVVNNGTLDGQIALFGFGNQLTNAGVIAITDPGTAVGAIHEIDGTFTQTATGTLALRVNAAGVSDQLFATSAHLAGTLFVVVQPGLYGSVTTYNGVVVACSCGGLNGTTFDKIATSSSSIFFTATATYDYAGVTAPIFDPNVSLTLTRIPFGAVPGETPNERAVGNALEAAYSTSLTGNAATFFTNLLQVTSAKVLDQLSGEGTSGTQQAAFLAQNLFISTLMGQGALWLQDMPDIGAPGAPMQYAPAEPELPVFKALSAQPATDARTDSRTWRMWAAGFGGTQSLRGDATVGSADMSGRTAGGAFGAEYRANPDLLVGFGIGGSSSSFSVPDRSTGGQLDGGHAGVYGVARWNEAYLAGTLTYSHFDNQTTRTIAGVGPTETATGSFASDEFGGRLEAGRRYGFGTFAVTPFAAIQFAELWQRGYTETSTTILGAPGILGLSYQPHATFSLPTFLGAQLDSRVVLDNGAVFAPFVRASWVHEFEPSRQISGTLVTVAMPFFTVDGARAAADALRIDAGVKLALTRAVALYANGAGEFSNLGQTYAATGGLRVSW